MWLTVSSWLAARAAVELTNSSLNSMGVCEVDPVELDVVVLGVERIDIVSSVCFALLYIPLAIVHHNHGLHHSQVAQITIVYTVVRNRTVRLFIMVGCMVFSLQGLWFCMRFVYCQGRA